MINKILKAFFLVFFSGLALIALGSFWGFNILVNPGVVCNYNGCRPKYPDELLVDFVGPTLLIIFGALILSITVKSFKKSKLIRYMQSSFKEVE